MTGPDGPVTIKACPGYVRLTIPCELYVPGPGDPGEPGLFTERMSPGDARSFADAIERNATDAGDPGHWMAVSLRQAADVAETPRLNLLN